MDAAELSQLMQLRYDTLSELLRISDAQIAAIAENRMSDLMRILSDKQQPIARLSEIGQRLATAAQDDPQHRQWPDEASRLRCREQQNQCDRMHQDLLAIEADCEARLQQSRTETQEKLQRFDSGRNAATRYAQSQPAPARRGQLDLSSD